MIFTANGVRQVTDILFEESKGTLLTQHASVNDAKIHRSMNTNNLLNRRDKQLLTVCGGSSREVGNWKCPKLASDFRKVLLHGHLYRRLIVKISFD